MTTYNAVLLQQAIETITDLLPFPIEEMVKLHRIDLAKLRDDQSVSGPINGDLMTWERYEDGWCGFAVGKEFSENLFWLIRKSELSGELTYFCLGAHQQIGGALSVAIDHVYLELAFKCNTGALPAVSVQ